jgi:hypothetical protein
MRAFDPERGRIKFIVGATNTTRIMITVIYRMITIAITSRVDIIQIPPLWKSGPGDSTREKLDSVG